MVLLSGDHVPLSSNSVSLYDESVPHYGDNVPPFGDSVPTSGDNVPLPDDSVPPSDNNVPPSGDSFALSGDYVLTSNYIVPLTDENVLFSKGGQCSFVQRQCSTVSCQSSAALSMDGGKQVYIIGDNPSVNWIAIFTIQRRRFFIFQPKCHIHFLLKKPPDQHVNIYLSMTDDLQ